MAWLFFVLGTAVGSFLNTVAERYNPREFLFSLEVVGGRSFCPLCKEKLHWYELVPVLSFLFLGGRCGHCGGKISFRYPLTEIAAGAIFISVYLKFYPQYFFISSFSSLIFFFFWLFVLSLLFLVSLVDWQWHLIPEEINLLLIISGFVLIIFGSPLFGLLSGSFLGNYALVLGFRGNIWLNHLLATFVGAVFFGFLILITRGRGMGMGDLKIAAALGWVFGWPDILLIVVLAFLAGSIVGIGAMIFKNLKFKSYLAFAPFLALGSFLVLMWGAQIIGWYFSFFF